MGLGTLIGGFVGGYGFEWALWLSIPPLLFAALLPYWLTDVRRAGPPGTKSEDTLGNYLSHFKDAAIEFRAHADLRFVTTYIAVGLVVFEILEEFDQLYYLATDVPVWVWGILAAGVEGCYAIANLYAYRLAGKPVLAWLLPLAGGALLVLSSIGASPYYVLILSFAYVIVAPMSVLAEARFHRVMEGRSRATTTSALVMADIIVGVFFTLVFGTLADSIGILPAYGWAGLAMAPLAIWVMRGESRGLRGSD